MKLSINDAFIFIGLCLLIYACWLVSDILGLFMLSFLLITIGILSGRGAK